MSTWIPEDAPERNGGHADSADHAPVEPTGRHTRDREPPRSSGTPERRIRIALVAGAALLLVAASWLLLDLDQDGLIGHEEVRLGTSLWHPDSDRDSLTDGWEHERGTAPRDADTDDDELEDGAELQHRADPFVADTDDDGLRDGDEVGLGTRPEHGDTDEDGALDGIEVSRGTDPLVVDTDQDGALDGLELRVQADPLSRDTDGDGLMDGDEDQAVAADCDGDGAHPIVDPDDDDDGLTDGRERDLGIETSDPCDPDSDDDGVLDGEEGAVVCIRLTDCDLDGVPDGGERPNGLDPLNPDTFDLGLKDAVVLAFKEGGQEPSGDDDDDGIPDAWESNSGLIDWGPFTPRPEEPDLLIEYVRVLGPQSGTPEHRRASYHDAYDRVADTFRDQAGIEVQWVETHVHLSYEGRPPLIPSADSGYYADVLGRARHSDNPYVTTVVMNPQQDQSQILHGGIAPIRGMLASIDVGLYTDVHYRTDSNQTIKFRPVWESLIAAGKGHAIQGGGVTGAGSEGDGTYYIATQDYTIRWEPFWFATPPSFHLTDGRVINTTHDRTVVRQAELASTIMHELGHTLGLCHLELSDCIQNLPADHQARRSESVMYSPGAMDTLGFLPGEWDQVREYIGCPPQGPVLLVAEGSTSSAIIDEKYTVAEHEILNVDSRFCSASETVPVDLEPADANATRPRIATHYEPLTAAERTATAAPVAYQPSDEMTWDESLRPPRFAPLPFLVPLAVGAAAAFLVRRLVHRA